MKQITIKKNENEGLNILKVLSIFRDKNLISSLEEMAHYMEMYKNDDRIIIKSGENNLDDITRVLKNENVNFEIE
nr:hypothetical protein [uncultured Chryseobacterium sp.]